jgi:hypothetical protein
MHVRLSVCEDSSRLVREKTRARLLQSSRFHHLCRFISWESEELDECPHALFLTAAREARPAITASRPFFAVRPAQPACARRVRE